MTSNARMALAVAAAAASADAAASSDRRVRTSQPPFAPPAPPAAAVPWLPGGPRAAGTARCRDQCGLDRCPEPDGPGPEPALAGPGPCGRARRRLPGPRPLSVPRRRPGAPGRREGPPPGVVRRPLGVLVRALAGPAEEVRGHQQGHGEHHDGQEDLSMHSQLTPGQWPGTASAAKPDAAHLRQLFGCTERTACQETL